MAENSQVVIVGAGVAGCSLAYSLSLRGIKSLIIERDAIARHASGVAAGLLTPSSEIGKPGPIFNLAQAALRNHRSLSERLKEQTGMDVLYAQQPSLRLALTQSEEAAMRSQLDWQKNTSWVTGSALAKLEPCATTAALGGAYSTHEARVNSQRLVIALCEAAISRGAAVRQGRVIGVKQSGDRLKSLLLDNNETVSGETFVFAMGPWAREAQAWLGLSLPVEPLRGQIVVLKPRRILRHAVFHGGNYVLPQPDGSVLAGTTEEWAGFDSKVTPEGIASILQTLKIMTPLLAEAEIVGSRAGLRPVCRDGSPIVGRAPQWSNVYLSTGYGRKGILLGPLLGECLAALVLQEQPPYDIGPFDPHRLLRKVAAAS